MDKLFENKTFFENIKKILEVSQERGCWKPAEMTSIGQVWEDLDKINKYIEENNKEDSNNNKEESNNEEESNNKEDSNKEEL